MKLTVSKTGKAKSVQSQLAELKRVNKELDRFVYSASHDLKAPLRSVMGIVQIAKSETTDQQQQKYLDMIFKSSMKLDNFINDLVNFSRNSRLAITAGEIDLNEVISEAFESISYMDKAANIDLRKEISGVPLNSDLARIRIIMGNIVSNAVKYQNTSPKVKPRLLVKAEVSRSKATISFIDNGEGISQKHLPEIFKMFYRASLNSQGSGLGLFIVKEVVKKLKGKISVSSGIKKGTTFTVIIPNTVIKKKK